LNRHRNPSCRATIRGPNLFTITDVSNADRSESASASGKLIESAATVLFDAYINT
jgi:hypothetical protein